jgi:hypothetical protein
MANLYERAAAKEAAQHAASTYLQKSRPDLGTMVMNAVLLDSGWLVQCSTMPGGQPADNPDEPERPLLFLVSSDHKVVRPLDQTNTRSVANRCLSGMRAAIGNPPAAPSGPGSEVPVAASWQHVA